MFTFKQWLLLREVGFSTSCVANFSLPIGGAMSRTWPPPISDSEWRSPEDDKKHHHKKHKKHG